MGLLHLKEDLRYAIIVGGVLCVMTNGAVLTPMSLAGSWDSLEQVTVINIIVVIELSGAHVHVLYNQNFSCCGI